MAVAVHPHSELFNEEWTGLGQQWDNGHPSRAPPVVQLLEDADVFFRSLVVLGQATLEGCPCHCL